jgi:DNA-binding HxlR family transcriptional regulator
MVVQGEQDAAVGPTVATVGTEHACDAGLVRAFEFLGKRWSGVILASLSLGPVGFAELRGGLHHRLGALGPAE